LPERVLAAGGKGDGKEKGKGDRRNFYSTGMIEDEMLEYWNNVLVETFGFLYYNIIMAQERYVRSR
jgi:hypothetical protein